MSRARDLANLGNNQTLKVDTGSNFVGIGTSSPSATLTAGAVGASGTTILVHGDGRLTGVLTASSFYGDLGGESVKVTDTTASTSTSTGALVISGGVGIAKSLYVDGGISVAGTITYNDVTNVDSVGFVTAGKGVRVTTGGIVVTAGVSTLTTVSATTANVGAGITLTASGIINAGFTTITGATETCTGVTTYLVPDSSSTKVTIECDASKGTLFNHDLSNGNVGIVSLSNLPIRGNSFTTYTILFTQLSSTPVGTGNTLPKNGIGTNVYLDGGFTGFTTRGRVASASTVTLSTTASDLDIVTLGVHYNGSGTAGKENFKVYVSGDTGYRIGND